MMPSPVCTLGVIYEPLALANTMQYIYSQNIHCTFSTNACPTAS